MSSPSLTELLDRISTVEAKSAELRVANNQLSDSELAEASNTAWVLTASIFVLLMQLGFAMLEGGTVRHHNVLMTYAKNILDFVIGAIAATWGISLAYGEDPYSLEYDQHARLLSYVAFQGVAATIVSGAMVERTNLGAYLLLSTHAQRESNSGSTSCSLPGD
jgi:Amt family ammonium transporter